MTLHIYAHKTDIEEMNERRAICRLAHVLHYSKCGIGEDDYLFIANIDPTKDHRIEKIGHLTQLDGLLLGPKSIAIVEFKNYFDPIEGKDLESKWYVRGRKKRIPMRTGKKINPVQQAIHARNVLHQYLQNYNSSLFKNDPKNSFAALYSFLLFHPGLHPKSNIPDLGPNDYWLRIRSIDAIAELALSAGPKYFELTFNQMKRIAEEAFFAKPWPEMSDILNIEWGRLMIQEPGDSTFTRIRLWENDELTIGRSRQFGHRITSQNNNVSRSHAHITIEGEQIRVLDLDSKNGTFHDGKPIDSECGILLSEKQSVGLGGTTSKEGTFIWFEKKGRRKKTISTQTNI